MTSPNTELLMFGAAGRPMGPVRDAVGAPFAVLVAEELFAAGCRLLISVTGHPCAGPDPHPL